MSNLIINPSLIWLIDVISALEEAAGLICAGSVIITAVAAFLVMAYTVDSPYCDDVDKAVALFKKVLKGSLACIVTTMLLVCLIPSSETMYAMLAASYVTEENVAAVGETAIDVVDYIFEKVAELQEVDNE